MIKLGILDFDTSHVVAFASRLNHVGVAEDQWVEGAKIVVGCPGESKIMPERIPGYAAEIKKMGIPLVDKPTEMIGKVDGMLIESQQGGVHLERARPFLEAGIPCFVDKPFTCSVADARALIDLAAKKKLPIFSSSSLRYTPEVEQLQTSKKHGKLHGALTYGPCSLHEGNPGLFHYGIHAVEMLYALMGPGCTRVACVSEKNVDVVTGQWQGGRVGQVRGLRAGKAGYGFSAFTDGGVVSTDVSTKYLYRDLLKQIVSMFQTGKSPLDPAVTLEIVGFIEAAAKSAANHGNGEKVAV